MKFRNPKTGEVYEDIEDAYNSWDCGCLYCDICDLSKLNNKSDLPAVK